MSSLLAAEMGCHHRPWVMGHPGLLPRRARDAGRDRVLFVGTAGHAIDLATRPAFQEMVLRTLMRQLGATGRPVELIVRPHHADRQGLDLPALDANVQVRVERSGTVSQALKGVAVMVTTVSTGIVEASLSGVPVAACPEEMTSLIAGMRSLPGVHWATSGEEAAEAALRALRGEAIGCPAETDLVPYVVPFIGWPLLAAHLRGLEPAMSDPDAARHAETLLRLMEGA